MSLGKQHKGSYEVSLSIERTKPSKYNKILRLLHRRGASVHRDVIRPKRRSACCNTIGLT